MQRTITKVLHTPVEAPKKKVAAYARVSSGKDAMLHSLSQQISYYSSMIQNEQGWQYVGVYSDEAITGTQEERPGFQQMISDCYAGKIDMIITKSVSRFARNTITLLETVRKLKDRNIDVYFEEQNVHSISPDGELVLTILASFAQEESLSASENQKWRIKKNFEEGIPWNGRMLGYRLDGDHYIVNEKEAEIVKRIYSEYLSGDGTPSIAKRLTEDGVPTMHGRPWHCKTVAKILRNYAYTGNLLLQKTYISDHITKKSKLNVGQLPMYHAEYAHEPIIPLDTFNLVQAEIQNRAKKKAPHPPRQERYAYTGLIQCAKCGKNFRRKTTASGVVWICSTYNLQGKAACASKQIPESTLDSITAEVTDNAEDVIKIVADDGNVLKYILKGGNAVTKVWSDKSRSQSWTPEKRELARQRAYERNRMKWLKQ